MAQDTQWLIPQPPQNALTNAELRATPIPVSGTVTASGPLTDTQLRASAVPVSGTVTANTGLTQPLTDTQLRASAVPISVASLPLPSGAATETTLSALSGKFASYAQTRYIYNIPSTVGVASDNTVMWDLFNADAALLVRILSIRQIPDIVTAVTGVAVSWSLGRTTSVGTGGSAQTAWLPDTSQTALDADITCRVKPSGGAAESTILVNYNYSSEETNTGTMMVAALGGLELVPQTLIANGQGILLRQNQGLRVVQITNTSAVNTGWLIEFTVE